MDARIIWGILLIAIGLMFLLQTLGLLSGGIALLWALLLGGAGFISLYIFLLQRANWWALIPGITLLSLAVLITLDQLAPTSSDIFGGTILLGGIGLSFWMVYVSNPSHWWAIIPAGTMTSLAVVALLDELLPQAETGGVFLIGLGLTFGLLAILPPQQRQMRWAFIPAAVLLLIGIFTTSGLEALFGMIWPVFLILAGIYLMVRTLRASR
jgi:hypothetical protein